ncbi:hypothetical protein PIGHUM_02916 [Pigmentiphaga humi]|uniref:Integrase DNA-binding domain-containing protein n=1 Tax=Pigmentiphaga humi TaxID=2478468 RepID=A0A3P4B3F9_9BURK|nr:integrase arm-type DNA-binding domain-containing protein [Pigmentiphaga humi]VCU70837.1 hypothetical protein PIGHUM_02916 [Pigmentiphaga humi]
MLAGRTREMGLGALSIVPLAQARAEAVKCRVLLKDKIDPIEARNAECKAVETAAARSFKIAAISYIDTQRPGWKNAKLPSNERTRWLLMAIR